MKNPFVLAIFLLASFVLSGCDSPKTTLETARKQLAAYKVQPTESNQLAVEQSLAKLDLQIAHLEEKGKASEADVYRKQASSLRADFQAARMARALNDAKNAIQGIGEAFKEAGKIFRDTVEDAPKDTNEPE